MHQLTVDDFAARLHDQFIVSDASSRWTLLLVEATSRGVARADRRTPFALLFHGPAAPVLPQATYRFEHPSMPPLDIFIVPVGPKGDAMQYEAIFT